MDMVKLSSEDDPTYFVFKYALRDHLRRAQINTPQSQLRRHV